MPNTEPNANGDAFEEPIRYRMPDMLTADTLRNVRDRFLRETTVPDLPNTLPTPTQTTGMLGGLVPTAAVDWAAVGGQPYIEDPHREDTTVPDQTEQPQERPVPGRAPAPIEWIPMPQDGVLPEAGACRPVRDQLERLDRLSRTEARYLADNWDDQLVKEELAACGLDSRRLREVLSSMITACPEIDPAPILRTILDVEEAERRAQRPPLEIARERHLQAVGHGRA